jgi:transcriptional regulator with XRE-family HTH domain
MPSTLKDVALRAGVSTTTVSHALNGTRFVQPETAARVREAARALGYSPNSVARGLRTGSSRTIGVLGPSALDAFFAAVLVGIEAACYGAGYELYIGYVEYPHGDLPDDSAAGRAAERDFLRAVLSGEHRAPCPPCADELTEKEGRLTAKLLARNQTAGLAIGSPILFSSVAHGSGFDIAGRGQANPAAMIEAISRLAGRR